MGQTQGFHKELINLAVGIKEERMIITSYILAPLVGGVIGYVTNDIAIRMLFRPHTAKYIMGRRVPFTPGIIPKEKGRKAEAVGTAISDNIK